MDAQNSTLFHGLTTIEQSGGTRRSSSITGSYAIPGATSKGIFNYSSTALAGTGTLGASISVDAEGLSFERDLPSVVGDAQAIYSEFFTFSGADPTVSTNLNTFLHGSLVSTCIDCGAGIIVSAIINNTVVASGSVSFSGDSRGVAQIIPTSSFAVPTNQPVYLGLKLEVLLAVRAPFEPLGRGPLCGASSKSLPWSLCSGAGVYFAGWIHCEQYLRCRQRFGLHRCGGFCCSVAVHPYSGGRRVARAGSSLPRESAAGSCKLSFFRAVSEVRAGNRCTWGGLWRNMQRRSNDPNLHLDN